MASWDAWAWCRSWGCSVLLSVGPATLCPSPASYLGRGCLSGWRPTCWFSEMPVQLGLGRLATSRAVALLSDGAADSRFPGVGRLGRTGGMSGEKSPAASSSGLTGLAAVAPALSPRSCKSPTPASLQSHRIGRGRFLGIKTAVPTPVIIQDVELRSVGGGGRGICPRSHLGTWEVTEPNWSWASCQVAISSPPLPPGPGSRIAAWEPE